MSNKGKILGFGALGLALLASSKKASSKTVVQDVAPVAFSGNDTQLQDLLTLIKNNGAIRTLLKGEKGDVGDIGEPASVGNHSFGNGVANFNGDNDLGDLSIFFAGRNGSYNMQNYMDVLTFRAVDNGVSTPVFSINKSGVISKIGGGSFSALSDERMKDNINPFVDGLEKILAIETKTFNYKKVEGTQTEFYPDFLIKKKQYGVIAQQLKTVCPEMVTVGEDGYLTVDLSNLSLLLVNAVKELDKKDTDQQKLITSQAAKIKALEEQQGLILDRLSSLESK